VPLNSPVKAVNSATIEFWERLKEELVLWIKILFYNYLSHWQDHMEASLSKIYRSNRRGADESY